MYMQKNISEKHKIVRREINIYIKNYKGTSNRNLNKNTNKQRKNT